MSGPDWFSLPWKEWFPDWELRAMLEGLWTLRGEAGKGELGIACSISDSAESSILLSFNPRERSQAFRDQIPEVLRLFQLPTAPYDYLNRIVPEGSCSWVLGLEISQRGDHSYTIYIEEIERFFSAEAYQVLRQKVSSYFGLVFPQGEMIGEEYILALDVSCEGEMAIKRYRFGDDPRVVHSAPELPSCFYQGAASWIFQWKDRSTRCKAYRCYPYIAFPSSRYLALEHWNTLLVECRLPSISLQFCRHPSIRITSIGLRAAEQKTATIYGCLFWDNDRIR